VSDVPQPSEYLLELIFTALEHGLDSIDDGAGPLVPFVLTDQDGEVEIRRFVTERLEEGVTEARRAAREAVSGGRIAVAAWDGFITLDGERTDAIFVGAADSPEGPTYTFCGRYRYKGQKLETIGNAAYVDCDEQLFP
jgi:hypothetical protein